MSALRSALDQVGTCLVVRLFGELTTATAPAVRTALAKSLVEQPDALVVDLSGLVVGQPVALTVFATVARQAAMWPGTPLLLCTPEPAVAERLRARGRLPVFGTAEQALAAAPRTSPLVIREALLPVTGAARHARTVTTEACARWDLPHLAGPAAVVANELVSNAVAHARTMVDLRLSLRRRYFLIAVHDGSAEPPRLPAADSVSGDQHGLRLVDGLARRWGSLPAADGKVVWAVLDRRPSRAA